MNIYYSCIGGSEVGVTHEIQYERVLSHIYFKKVELENVSIEQYAHLISYARK